MSMLERRRATILRSINGAIWLATTGIVPLSVGDILRIFVSSQKSELAASARGQINSPAVFCLGVFCCFLLGSVLLGLAQGLLGFVLSRSIAMRNPKRVDVPSIAAIHFSVVTAVLGSLCILFFVRRGYISNQRYAYFALFLLTAAAFCGAHVTMRFREKFRIDRWGRIHALSLTVFFLCIAFFLSCVAFPPAVLSRCAKHIFAAAIVASTQFAVFWQYVYWRPQLPKMGTLFHNASVFGAVAFVVAVSAFFGTSLIRQNMMNPQLWDAGLLSGWLFDHIGPWING